MHPDCLMKQEWKHIHSLLGDLQRDVSAIRCALVPIRIKLYGATVGITILTVFVAGAIFRLLSTH